jgi:hypothetical protein
MFAGQPFRRTETGRIQLNLTPEERHLIRELPGELIKQLAAGDDDGSIYRLFPPGYTADLGRQVEYDRLMRDDLQEAHVAALRQLQDSADWDELSEEELHTWTRAINQLRLVLGTRIGVTEDISEEDLLADDPRISAFALYSFLSDLQESAVWALRNDDLSDN